MKKKGLLILLLALCISSALSGCRKKIAETEPETQTETVTEAITEKNTEKPTEKETEKVTEKKTVKATEKTTVKPSTVKPNTTTGNTATTETKMCPYCYNYIALTPNSDGTTVYSVHVAQEKAWADTYGYGTTQTSTEASVQTTEAPSQPATDSAINSTDDSSQCSFCYQWFSVSDGTYAAHIAQEQANITSNNTTTEYVQCPVCSNVYPSGVAYDTHVCITN